MVNHIEKKKDLFIIFIVVLHFVFKTDEEIGVYYLCFVFSLFQSTKTLLE